VEPEQGWLHSADFMHDEGPSIQPGASTRAGRWAVFCCWIGSQLPVSAPRERTTRAVAFLCTHSAYAVKTRPQCHPPLPPPSRAAAHPARARRLCSGSSNSHLEVRARTRHAVASSRVPAGDRATCSGREAVSYALRRGREPARARAPAASSGGHLTAESVDRWWKSCG